MPKGLLLNLTCSCPIYWAFQGLINQATTLLASFLGLINQATTVLASFLGLINQATTVLASFLVFAKRFNKPFLTLKLVDFFAHLC
jgi:hypothetical protein